MDISDILAELRTERDRIDDAIAAIEKLSNAATNHHAAPSRSINRRGSMSAAARKRMSRIMKLRWAAKKKQERRA